MIPTLNSATAGGGLALPDFVALAAKYGFEGVEFGIGEAAQLSAQHGFPAVAAIFEKHKVLPAVFGMPVDWRGDENTFQAGLKDLPQLAKLAQDLDCTRCTTYILPVEKNRAAAEYAETSSRRFIEIARVLANEGVRFGLEFIGPKHFRADENNVWFYDIPGALRVVEQIQTAGDLENVGLLVDCFHWFTSGGSAMDLASIPLEQIVHVHINDAMPLPADEQTDQIRLLPGASGAIDIKAFLQTLGAIGYDGPVAVETFSEDLRAMTPDDAARAASQAVNSVFTQAGIKPLKLL